MTLDVTRRRRPVARLSPLQPTVPTSPWPDLERRARAVFGKRVVTPGPAEPLLADRGAFELLVGRGSIIKTEGRAIGAHLDEDLEAQRLVRIPLDLERVFDQAGVLSRTHSARALTRSLDLLHVAAALVIRCSRFVSADSRQLAVARAAGLTAVEPRKSRAQTGPGG